MASLKLMGGCIYCNVLLKECENNEVPNQTELKSLTKKPFADHVWDDNTVIMANFNSSSLAGSNFEGSYGNVKYFKIYKTFSEQPKMHKVYTTTSSEVGVIEDFTVGSACPYTYYVYPICEETDANGNTYEVIGSMIQSKPIELHDGIIRVIGLIQDEENPDLYYVDTKNLWHFDLNISDTGFTNNMSKTYTDTLHQYPKEIKGNGNYRTFPIEGLLGRYDCDKQDYIDTYDDIIEWEKFMNNDELKMAIDLRGIVSLGSIDTNSFQYSENGANEVSVSFTFKQLEDLEHVTVINHQLPANPLTHDLLADVDVVALKGKKNINDDNDSTFLATKERDYEQNT